MRRVFSGFARGFAVAAVVVALAVPAQAKPRDGGFWGKQELIKIVKRWIQTTLDQMSEPKP